MPNARIPGRVRAALPWIVAGASLAAAAWALGFRGGDGDATPVAVTFDVPPFSFNTSVSSVGVSRDGETVAYIEHKSGESHLVLRSLSDPTPHPVAGTSNAMSPVFSPDGKSILFSSGGKWRRVAIAGGATESLAESSLDGYEGADWGPNGAIAVGAKGLAIVARDGRPARRVMNAEHGQVRPLVLGDRETVVFVDWGPGFTEDDFLGVGSVRTGEYTLSKITAVQPLNVIGTWLVYLTADGTITTVRLDVKRHALVGEPVRLLDGVLATPGAAALSASGTLVYAKGPHNRRLVLRDSSGAITPATEDLRSYGEPRFSPDGNRMAVPILTGTGAGSMNIWILDRRSKTSTRLTSVGNVLAPVWTRDGKRIVFRSWEGSSPTIWMQPADGSAVAEKLVSMPGIHDFGAVEPTPDGTGLIFATLESGKCSLFYMALDAKRQVEPLLSDVCWATLSPDGKWLAYVSAESGTPEVFVRPFRAPGGRVQISSGGGLNPVWAADAGRLFYIDTGNQLLTVAALRRTATTIEVMSRTRRQVNMREVEGYDVTPDGSQVLMVMDSEEPIHYVAIKNWITEFRARIKGR